MDGAFENFEYSKFQDVHQTIAATCLSIFIAPAHMKKQHIASFGYFSLPEKVLPHLGYSPHFCRLVKDVV
ncbi:hypothetical protein [Janthinobacterium lividum]|jgi:hypothetical protein|uniref:hypothetical protein n=1 Tax=Janthinobacterium sp. LB2P10 TaxID=3424194 RepID=UPI000FE13E31